MTEINIGEYNQGEIPVPLVYTFQNSAGEPIDLLNYQAKFVWRELWGAATESDAVVTDTSAGEATYTWDGAEFAAPGHYIADLWVGNGLQRFASERIVWTVRAAAGPVPAL